MKLELAHLLRSMESREHVNGFQDTAVTLSAQAITQNLLHRKPRGLLQMSIMCWRHPQGERHP